jgi:hypothetical protein
MKKIKMGSGVILYYDLPDAFGCHWVMVSPWGNTYSDTAPAGMTYYIEQTKRFMNYEPMTIDDVKDLMEAIS